MLLFSLTSISLSIKLRLSRTDWSATLVTVFRVCAAPLPSLLGHSLSSSGSLFSHVCLLVCESIYFYALFRMSYTDGFQEAMLRDVYPGASL